MLPYTHTHAHSFYKHSPYKSPVNEKNGTIILLSIILYLVSWHFSSKTDDSSADMFDLESILFGFYKPTDLTEWPRARMSRDQN